MISLNIQIYGLSSMSILDFKFENSYSNRSKSLIFFWFLKKKILHFFKKNISIDLKIINKNIFKYENLIKMDKFIFKF